MIARMVELSMILEYSSYGQEISILLCWLEIVSQIVPRVGLEAHPYHSSRNVIVFQPCALVLTLKRRMNSWGLLIVFSNMVYDESIVVDELRTHFKTTLVGSKRPSLAVACLPDILPSEHYDYVLHCRDNVFYFIYKPL